jgi:hypothetical protein
METRALIIPLTMLKATNDLREVPERGRPLFEVAPQPPHGRGFVLR